ncbi:membrane-bound lytic murein transglycosylase F [Desulfobaculum bizertense DSM 18034]|uniref:Membrane-bound lytic murein transglycosylase F n=3 Tax=Desulfobaculum TaxID=1433996 RepID=A0A1T4WSL0_9BACT|nr:membrane-bound lytic murein transglycosylase F [Desulfobaculum bizertense DSM 18034]
MTIPGKKSARSGKYVLGVIFLILAVQVALTWKLRHAAVSPLLRVVAPSSQWMEGSLSPYGPGFEQELLNRFCQENGMRWEWEKADSWDEAWEMVRNGKADLIIGLGAQPPKNMDVSLVVGPAYARFDPLLVRAKGSSPSTGDCGKVIVASNADLDSLSLPANDSGCAPTPVVPEDVSLRSVLDSLSKDGLSTALVDSGRYRLLQPFYSQLTTESRLSGSVEYRWFWSERSKELSRALVDFWARTLDSPAYKDIYDRYFGFLPERTDPYEMRHFMRTLKRKLPTYEEQILLSASKYGIDPLLLVAVIYQESHFNSRAKSKTGVRGLMQLTIRTAKELGVNRNNPFDSIEGGAAYLASLFERFEGTGLTPADQWFFALAAYNRGRGHVLDAMTLAKAQGGSGRTWRELKDVFPKLSYAKYYRNSKYGYTRGFEVVHYVEKIRYFYYVLNGLVVLSRPEAQQLAMLVGPSLL